MLSSQTGLILILIFSVFFIFLFTEFNYGQRDPTLTDVCWSRDHLVMDSRDPSRTDFRRVGSRRSLLYL